MIVKTMTIITTLMQHVMFDNNNGLYVALGYVIITLYNYDDVVIIKNFNITVTNPSQGTGNSINDYSARNLLINMLHLV